MAETGQVTANLTELAALLLAVEDTSRALRHLARIAVAVVPDEPSCGITVIRNGRPVTEVYEGSVPARVEEAQYEFGDGPGLQAQRTGAVVVAQDLAAEDRWGGWPAVAVEAGARGAYAHPLTVAGETLGALSLYAHEPGLFPEEVQRISAQFAEPAAMLLGGVLRRQSQDEVIGQLRAAMSSRAVIDQAIGIVMARYRCGPDDAFRVLRRMSNDRNVKLRVVAENLVSSFGPGRDGRLPVRFRRPRHGRGVRGAGACRSGSWAGRRRSRPSAGTCRRPVRPGRTRSVLPPRRTRKTAG